MAKVTGNSQELLDAIRGLGIEPNGVSKLIIEIVANEPVRIHVQGCADRSVIGVIKAIDGDAQVIRHVPERGDGE